MSRSNPTDNTPNPATRWFEWNGEQGTVRYYDKAEKKNIDVGTEFSFILLDQLASVGGWHEASESGIYSNEVRDTRQDVMLVKSFKGGTIAEGLYKAIKDKASVAGGYFVANCYIAYKNGDGLTIGSLKFKGAALHAWTEFVRANRAGVYEKAIEIHGFTEGKKGRVVYRVPELRLKDLSPASNSAAVELDKQLQAYLEAYLKRTKREQVEAAAPTDDLDQRHDDPYHQATSAPSDDDIPF